MSTSNFAYENRCIVVTDDDFEFGNVPETECIPQGFTSYPQSLIPTDFRFWDVVLTSGYYEAACIDYERKDLDWECELGFSYGCCPTSKREFYAEIQREFGISMYRLRKLCDGIKRENFEYEWKFTDALCEAVGEWLAGQEEAEVNKYLDELMEEYGYQEYVCVACFSNGEAWYSPKKTEGREALLQACES